MQISSRFTVAVHTLLAIDTFEKEYKTTSEFLASSVNVNPVVIRRTLQSLKGAGFIGVKAGSGGAYLVRDPQEITLYDVYRAVDCGKVELFHFHENPNPNCPVGKNIYAVLDQKLDRAQRAMEGDLKNITLADLRNDLNGYL